ncbi:hypothetical protein Pmani_008590 [Petrolisthes manimaculis]|uniref:TFIIS N-terminal domain-containing protein n=1 Tax=Petrolisthes manimaculis TaxID=1843537 RepID=A0AAE1UHM6_9EUCA|nr:hypothetical protein Pmani_008590 [Petrolisthes manimaculis]
MDKFVVRLPRNSTNSPTKKGNRTLKQATLESLKGVVVVEELERARVVLERSDVGSELKVDTLENLLRKNPAKEVLIRTRLGKTIHWLCKCEDKDVAAAAKKVYEAWRSHILSKTNRPTIEVKCDLKTQGFRDTARRMILDALRIGGEGKSEEGTVEMKEIPEVKDRREKRKLEERKDLFEVKGGKRRKKDVKKDTRKGKEESRERDGMSRKKGGERMSVVKMDIARVTDREEKGKEKESLVDREDKKGIDDEMKKGKKQSFDEENGNSVEKEEEYAKRESKGENTHRKEKSKREDRFKKSKSKEKEGDVSKRNHIEEAGSCTKEVKRKIGRLGQEDETVESQRKKVKEEGEDGSVKAKSNGSVIFECDGDNNKSNAESTGKESKARNNTLEKLREEEGRSADRQKKEDKNRDGEMKDRDRRKSQQEKGRKGEGSKRHKESGNKTYERESRGEDKRRDRKGDRNRKEGKEKDHSIGTRNKVDCSKKLAQKNEGQTQTEGNDEHTQTNEDGNVVQIDKDDKLTNNKLEQKEDEESNDANSVVILAEYIEREVYSGSRRLVSTSYRRTIRSIVFGLRHQANVRQSILTASITVPELVKQHYKV